MFDVWCHTPNSQSAPSRRTETEMHTDLSNFWYFQLETRPLEGCWVSYLVFIRVLSLCLPLSFSIIYLMMTVITMEKILDGNTWLFARKARSINAKPQMPFETIQNPMVAKSCGFLHGKTIPNGEICNCWCMMDRQNFLTFNIIKFQTLLQKSWLKLTI